MKVFERRKFRLRVKSPVHIGCGEVYDPFSFIVDESNGCLLIVDQDMLIKSLPDKLRREFSRICLNVDPKSILDIYKFMRRVGERKDIVEKPGVVIRRVSVVPGFIEHYKKVLRGDPKRNIKEGIAQFVVKRTAYEPNGGFRPFIPGSSLKGALRTAVLNMWKSNAKKGKYGHKENRNLEIDILGGSFSNDPFSLIKVSDFTARSEVKTKIFYAVNVKKRQHKSTANPSTIADIFEAVYEGEFEGEMTLLQPPPSSPKTRRTIKRPLTIADLLKATRFYLDELKKEYELLKEMADRVPMSWKTSFMVPSVVRIGCHSGAECVTVEGFRKIKIRNKPGFSDHATTIWLASNYKTPKGCAPFGWCELEEIKK